MTDDTIRNVQLRADEILERKRAAAEEMYAALKAQEALEQFDEKHGTTVADQPSYHFEHARLFDEAQRLRTAALAKADGREVQS